MNDRFIKKLWHTNRKIFLKEFSILQTINSDGNVEHTYFEYNHKTQNLERLSSCQIKEIDCTGLKDKNGKLIYEGDIIEFTDNVNINGSKTHIAKVEHREEFNAYMYHAECMGWYTINPSQNKVFKVKVIGNIYENEDLLKCENQ